MAGVSLESLDARFRSKRDLDALVEIFDRVAPDFERLAREGGLAGFPSALKDGEVTLYGLPAETVTARIKVGLQVASNIHDFEINLTHPFEGPFEVVIGRPVEVERAVSLDVLLVEADNAELDELGSELAALSSYEERIDWFRTASSKGRGQFLSAKVEVLVDSKDVQLQEQSITPTRTGKFSYRETTSKSYFGRKGTSTESEWEGAYSALALGPMPQAMVQLELSSEDYEPLSHSFDCRGERDSSLKEILLLRRKRQGRGIPPLPNFSKNPGRGCGPSA